MPLKGFSASEDELKLANKILLLSHCQGGALTSDAAIDIFKRSGLPYTILRDIWNMADENASGDLSIDELTAAIRLMGWIQTGESLEESLLTKSGPLPTIDGITDAVGKRSVNPLASQFPPINHDDIRHFKRSFNAAGPVGGFLDGDIVLEIYMTSNLSYGDLWKIRKLVDVSERGSLDFREFAMGMYLIQALQLCFISSIPSAVPPELHDLFSNPTIFDLHPVSQRQPSHRSKTPLRPSPSHSHILPSVPLIPVHNPSADDSWGISPIERAEADKHFKKLDIDRKGYIEEKRAANFMLSYKLSSADLAHIWSLADLNNDNHLTRDEFAVAVYLMNRKIAGEEIPVSLPPSLVPPSMRSMGTTSPTTSPPMSPKLIAMFKPPPPPPPGRGSSRVKRPQNSPISTISDRLSHLSLPTPPLPPHAPGSHPGFPTSCSSLSSPPETISPFEDPANGTSTSTHHSPINVSKPLSPDNSNNEALEELKKETSRLTLQVVSLLSQLTAQNSLRDTNETLMNERDSLKAQMREMERTVSEVLSAHDQNGSQEQYIQEIGRLSTELATKESQHESAQRMVAVLTEEGKDLRQQLRESQATTAKAKSEAEDLRQSIASREGKITELNAQLSDMGKAMAEEPTSTSNNRELRVLFRNVTRENDSLKGEVRDMQKAMEQLLLSTKFHAKVDEVERENRRLQAHIQDLEMLATQLQSSTNNSPQRTQAIDELTLENERLKARLQTGSRAFAELRTTSEAKISELQQKLLSVQHENNQLKMDSSGRGQRQEDSDNVPPPAYNDSFVIPP